MEVDDDDNDEEVVDDNVDQLAMAHTSMKSTNIVIPAKYRYLRVFFYR
jgi:hypothetical protein